MKRMPRDPATCGPTIPRAITSLVGREADLAALADLVRSHRLITLAGTGGVGKTRLAAAVAGRTAASGVMTYWVDAAPCTSHEALCSTLTARLGTASRADASWIDAVADILRDGPTLLALDDVEHIVDAAAGLVDDLLRAVPDLSVMLTSREPLGLTGETVYRVPSLEIDPDPRQPGSATQPASTRLFVERACDVRPDLDVDAELLATIREICTRLDGIPLAIELAAARMRHMPATAILDALQDRFRLLTGGSRTAVARHRTMQMSMDWSYHLLDEREQCALRTVSVFRDRFTLDAACALIAGVCGGDLSDAAETLGRLVDKSMVSFDGSWYRLLDTVRAYALELCDPAELAASRDAHASWHAAWLREQWLHGDSQHVEVQIAAREPDLLAALEWLHDEPLRAAGMVARLAGYWYRASRVSDIITYGHGTLATLRPVDELAWARLACSLSFPSIVAYCNEFLDHDLPDAVEIVDEAQRHLDSVNGHLALAYHQNSWREAAAALAAAERAGSPVQVVRSAAQLSTVGADIADPATVAAAIDALDRYPAALDATSREIVEISRMRWDYTRGRLTDAVNRIRALLEIDDLDPTIELACGINACVLGLRTHDRALAARGVQVSRAIEIRRGWHGFAEALEWAFHPTVESPSLEALAIPFGGGCDIGALALADVGRFDDARRLLALAPTDAAAGSYVAVETALVAASICQLEGDGAEPAWQEILGDASRGGYAVLAVQAFEGLAARSTGVPRVAQRLLGAAARLRAETGYCHRFGFQQAWVAEAEAACAGIEEQPGADLDWHAVAAWAERGRRDRHRPSLGWTSLTRAELAVVELTASGLTNPEIAERLLMSRATVKTHLAHVFTKLDVRTRTELATAWHDRSGH